MELLHISTLLSEFKNFMKNHLRILTSIQAIVSADYSFLNPTRDGVRVNHFLAPTHLRAEVNNRSTIVSIPVYCLSAITCQQLSADPYLRIHSATVTKVIVWGTSFIFALES